MRGCNCRVDGKWASSVLLTVANGTLAVDGAVPTASSAADGVALNVTANVAACCVVDVVAPGTALILGDGAHTRVDGTALVGDALVAHSVAEWKARVNAAVGRKAHAQLMRDLLVSLRPVLHAHVEITCDGPGGLDVVAARKRGPTIVAGATISVRRVNSPRNSGMYRSRTCVSGPISLEMSRRIFELS